MDGLNDKKSSFLAPGWISGILLFSLFFLVFISYLTKFSSPLALDDWAVLRASSYIAAFPTDPIMERMEDHFSNSRSEMGEGYYGRYLFRFKFFGNYVLTDYAILLLESAPMYFVYQSVFIITLSLHLVALLCIVTILRWQVGFEYKVLLMFMILSIVPKHLGIFENYQFTLRGDDWLHTLPRSPMLLFLLGAYIMLLNPARKEISVWKKYPIIAFILVIAFLLHRSMAIMYFLIFSFVLAAYRIVRTDPLRWVDGRKSWHLFLPYNLILIVMAGIKYALFVNWGVPRIGPSVYGFSWVILVNILLYLWIRLRKQIANSEPAIASLGDSFVNILLPISILGLGLELIVLDPGALRWSNSTAFYIMEVGARLGSMIHLLWWLSLAVVMFAVFTSSERVIFKGERIAFGVMVLIPLVYSPSLNNLLIFVLGILIYQIFNRIDPQRIALFARVLLIAMLALISIRPLYAFAREFVFSRQYLNVFDCELLHIQSTTYLQEFGGVAYRNEIAYFHALSNEMRAEHLPNARVMDDFSCRVLPNLTRR